MKERLILQDYIPAGAVDQVLQWIKLNRVHLRITRARASKLGDYRSPIRGGPHRITVNHNLNPYAFLITFVHELAHLKVYERYGNKVLPHGTEWKQEFKSLMSAFLDQGLFPGDLQSVLHKSLANSRASSTSDIALSRVLARYDKPNEHSQLEVLEHGQLFRTANGRKFRKGDLVRTRFKCLNLQNNRYYLFHPLTPVMPVLG